MFFPASIDLYLKALTVLSSYMKNTISIDCYRYNRPTGIADIYPMDDDILEGVSGGLQPQGAIWYHNVKRTGREKDDSYFIFWTRRYVEYKCTRYDAKMWEAAD